MPSVTFFYYEHDYAKPTITIQSDGSFHQIKKFKGKVIIQLMPQPRGPTCAQLSCAAWLASMAVKRDHTVELIFKAGTSQWTYDHQLPLNELMLES